MVEASLVNESSFNSYPVAPTAHNIPNESSVFNTTKIFFYFVILLCTTVGNTMVAYVICTSKKMRSCSNLLILNLAICDLLTPLISIPFDFALEENGYVWMYGKLMCKILGPGATLTTTASSLTLAAISLDRYRIIMHPFKTRLSSRQIKFIVAGIYLFSVLAVCPYAYVLHVKNSTCQENWQKDLYRQLYTMALFLIQYALPLVFMIVMYAFAIANLHSASDKMRNNSINAASFKSRKRSIRRTLDGNQRRGFFHRLCAKRETTVSEKQSANAQATRMFMTVVAVFSVFMFPNQVLWLWADYGNGAEQPHFNQAAIICWLFTYTNGVVNPIIFAIFSKEFRNGFKNLFKLVFCCNQDVLPNGIGRFEFLTRTGTDSSSHSAAYDGTQERYKHEHNNSCYVAHYAGNSLEKPSLDPYPSRSEDNGILSKSQVEESTRPAQTNYIRDITLQDSHDESTHHSYAEETRSDTFTEPERQTSVSLIERSLPKSKALHPDEDIIVYLPVNTEEEMAVEVIDENALMTFIDLPETDC